MNTYLSLVKIGFNEKGHIQKCLNLNLNYLYKHNQEKSMKQLCKQKLVIHHEIYIITFNNLYILNPRFHY